MTRSRRVTPGRLAIAAGIVAFLVVSAFVARWLQADNVERAQVERVLAAQARGDARGMAAEIAGCDEACRTRVDGLAASLAGDGDLEIVRYDSDTAHALGASTGPTRVVWRLAGADATLPTVQCVAIRRTGNVLTGPRVRVVGLSSPIGGEESC